MKVLCIRFSSIGDIILTTPVVRCLKKQRGAEVHFLTKKPFRPLLEENPYVDRLITIEKQVGEISALLKAEKYDWVADLHHNLRAFHVRSILRTAGKSFPKLNIEKWLYVRLKINRLPQLHIVDRYFKTIEPLGVKNDGKGLDYFIPSHTGRAMSRVIRRNDLRPYCVLVTGAGHRTKALEVPQMVRLVDKIDRPVLLVGGPAEKPLGRQISEGTRRQVLDLTGELSLHESAYIIQNSAIVITPDTGMMHIAAAFRKPVLSIWGNTVPEFGMYPYYGAEAVENTIFEIRPLACRPCSKIGFPECPRGHFKCIRSLDPDHIAARANRTLRENSSGEIRP